MRVPGSARPARASSAAIRSRAARWAWAWFHATHRLRSGGLDALRSIVLWKFLPGRRGLVEPAESGVAAYIGRWRPSSVSPQAAAFARDVICQVAPAGRERAKNLLWAAGRLADYAASLGLDLDPQVVFHPSVIERFARSAPGLPGVTRRTLRTSQRFIARRVVPQLHPADVPLPRERSKAPYTAAEIDGFLALADAQPTRERRMRASGLVCLGAGAGLIRADLRDVRGSDVTARSGGLVAAVRGRRARAVPVLPRYHARLLAAARFAGNGLICGGADPGRRNRRLPPRRLPRRHGQNPLPSPARLNDPGPGPPGNPAAPAEPVHAHHGDHRRSVTERYRRQGSICESYGRRATWSIWTIRRSSSIV